MGSIDVSVVDRRGRHQHGWKLIMSLVLDAVASRHTRRAYAQALDEFLIWFQDEPGRAFNKATVQKYRSELESKGLSPSSINVRLSGVRRLALEAADNGLLDPDLAAGIGRARGAKRRGVRLGNWLTRAQADELLGLPDPKTIKGVRDRALLALLIAAGLRRSELAGLNCEHIQQRDGRWLIADLIGKHGRIRTIPLPSWAYRATAHWMSTAAISQGPLFRSLTRHGHITARQISSQTVFSIVKAHAQRGGMRIGPHDLRRTFAKLAYMGKSPLEQIQFSLGHASVVTTEVYLGAKQDLQDAPCDHLGLEAFGTAIDAESGNDEAAT
jgi:site-specific recombinase XerD